ncbi:hypothetical protein BKX93_15275 [Chromobacterium vaccinii]|uniref:Uncharacterized protein n=1 Tax=Chromobacterium vaccinii TaxID=1108595 RepID=A0A1D9LIW7_9NEIS|nr:hypothetical protein BKX93_15275 [Chromobacterium vaccinii]
MHVAVDDLVPAIRADVQLARASADDLFQVGVVANDFQMNGVLAIAAAYAAQAVLPVYRLLVFDEDFLQMHVDGVVLDLAIRPLAYFRVVLEHHAAVVGLALISQGLFVGIGRGRPLVYNHAVGDGAHRFAVRAGVRMFDVLAAMPSHAAGDGKAST